MKLETDSKTIRDAKSEDLLSRLRNAEFAILSADEMNYIQCRRLEDDTWELEYQAGSTDDHFAAADGSIALDRVEAAFLSYLAGDGNWQHAFDWQRVEV